MMEKKTIVIGVTSGIAAYKTLDLVRSLKKDGAEVFVVMTKSAMAMVPASKFKKASGNKVYSNLFEKGFDYADILKIRRVDHIDLADKADVVVIAPATANIIAKIAHGIADDFLTTMTLATTAPIIVCPSMNVHMWQNPVVQENIDVLRRRRYIIIEPEKGMLACGYEGKGMLAHIQMIKNEVVGHLQFRDSLSGKKIIVTAGGTLEKIDDVRYITNRSSGKMGVAIAQECFVRGADVLLLRAKNAVEPRYAIQEKTFITSGDLFSYLKKLIPSYDIIFQAAAISDFRVAKPMQGKISSNSSFTLALKPVEKIVNKIKHINSRIRLIAFKAEYNRDDSSTIQIAKQKLKETNADAIIANDIGKKDRGFEADTNEVIVVFSDGTYRKVSLTLKQIVAQEIVTILMNRGIL